MILDGEYREVIWAKDFNLDSFYLFCYNRRTKKKQRGNEKPSKLTKDEKESMFCAPMYTGYKNCATEDWVRCYYKPWVYAYVSNTPISEKGFICVNDKDSRCSPLCFYHINTSIPRSGKSLED